MAKITKNSFVVAAVLFALCSLSAGAEQQKADVQEKVENPFDRAGVTIDAYVIEVNLINASQLGLTPRSQKNEAVSVEKIQMAIGKGTAKVTAGAKVAAQNYQAAVVKCFQKTNVVVQFVADPNQGGAPRIIYQPYDTGLTFFAQPVVSPNGAITLSYKFEQTGFNVSAQTDKAPDTSARSIEGKIRLDSGKPIIAGSTQSDDEVYFLIISATIESK